MGAVAVRREVHDALMQGPAGTIELFHGYTYSGHPAACAAALATLEIYRREALFERAAALAPVLEDAVHSLRDLRGVTDIRNYGLMAAIDLEPREGAIGARGYEAMLAAFEAGLLVRFTADTLALSPPLIISEEEVGRVVDVLRKVIGGLV
jgi:beta-alanine--pyruvate transaminase